MGLDTESGGRFMSRKGRAVHFVEKHQGVPMDFWYVDRETGREFDVRELPQEILGADRDAVLQGDRETHRVVIRRAIDAKHDFRRKPATAG